MRTAILIIIFCCFYCGILWGVAETEPEEALPGAVSSLEDEAATGGIADAAGVIEADGFLRSIVNEEYPFPGMKERFRAPLLQKYLLERAIEIYKEAARRYPGNERAPAALYVVGKIETVRGERDKAFAAYTSVIDGFLENDYSDDAQFMIAEMLFSEGNYEDARKECYKLIDTYLRSELVPNSYLMVAKCNYKLMSYEKAIKVYLKTIENFDDVQVGLEAGMGLADTYLANGDFDNALKQYNEIISGYPETKACGRARFMTGRVYGMKGNYPASRKVFREIAQGNAINEYVDDAYYEKAWTYYTEKKYAQAIQSYVTALAKYPGYEGKIRVLGYVADSYRHLFLYRDALMKYEELLDIYTMFDTTEMIDSEKSRHKRGVGEVLFTMGEIYLEKGEMRNALAKFFSASDYLKDIENSSRIAFAVAGCYFRLGYYREALKAYEDFVSNNPRSPSSIVAQAQQAECYDKIGYLERSQEKYQEVINSDPEELTEDHKRLMNAAVFRVGELYEEQGMRREEASFYEEILTRKYEFLDMARISYILGTVYEDIDNLDSAIAIYKKVMDDYKESQWYELAKINLEILRINQRKPGR